MATTASSSPCLAALVAVTGLFGCANNGLSSDAGAHDLALHDAAGDLFFPDGGASDLTLGDLTSGDAGHGCAGYLDLVADNGAPRHYTSICQGSWGNNQSTTAVGYRFSGGPFPGVTAIDINGCKGPNANSEGASLSAHDAMGPGTYPGSTVSYTDSFGTVWSSPGYPASIVLTRVDPVGGVIEGSFTASVTHGSDSRSELKGTFHVCRVPDELAP